MKVSKSSSRQVNGVKIAQANQRIGANYGSSVEAVSPITSALLDSVVISPRGRAMQAASDMLEEREAIAQAQREILMSFDEMDDGLPTDLFDQLDELQDQLDLIDQEIAEMYEMHPIQDAGTYDKDVVLKPA